MRYIVSRLCGLLNRQIATYDRLSAEMLSERQALLTRDFNLLRGSLERQQSLVDEIHDIIRDYNEEVETLYQSMGLERLKADADESVLIQKLGRDGEKMKRVGNRLKQVVKRAKKINQENQKIIEVSNAFFRSYIQCLNEIRCHVFGYNQYASSDDRIGQNLLLNQHI